MPEAERERKKLVLALAIFRINPKIDLIVELIVTHLRQDSKKFYLLKALSTVVKSIHRVSDQTSRWHSVLSLAVTDNQDTGV